MALNDKNIIITPNIGSTSDPKIEFKGADASTGPSTITATVYPTNGGTLSFQATEGTLFSISNSLSSGSIFSVNPISGIPIIDVNANRTIALNPYGGNTGIGTTNPTSKLHVTGDTLVTGVSTASRFVSNVATGTAPLTVTSTTLVTNLNADLVDGIQASSFYQMTNNPNSPGSTSGTVLSAGTNGSSYDFLQSHSGKPLNLNPVGNTVQIAGNTAWHAGNDGAGSGLDADLLDGLNATSANTASTIVARDASGNFSAGTITASLTGAASLNVLKAGDTMTGQLISTLANSTTTGGGQIYLNGATGNRIDFNQNGVAAPAFTTRSAGTKLVLYPNISGSSVDFAFGIEGGTLWSSVENTSAQFKWYAGTTNVATLTGAGNFSATGSITGNTIVKSGGTASQFLKANGSVDSNVYITSASVGNGTLSLSVSGTGLSGGASFTANQSENGTFTVTSNATSANTASTIVARDASGNFTAGTITATSFSGSLANTLTLNTSGTGLSGSTTFNNSGAATFTVTSNATSANTASTIVARDASNNFSAGTISAALSASADQAIVNQNNGNSAAWYGRILSKNSTSDKASFLGTYGSIAGVFAHNNALTAWADLYVNTVDGSSGGTVRMPSSVLVNGNQVWHLGNDGAGTGLDADLLDGINSTGLFNNMGNTHGTRSSFDATTPSYDFGFRYVQGSTNGPGTSGSQFYSWYIGLGSDYPSTGAGSYGAMFAVDRNVTNPYLTVRYNEGNAFTSWYKIRAGAADILTTARTINGTSFDGSANITITSNTTNSITFNNGGAGAASGTTFNGSAAQTISYNTIGASPLAGSASLTTTGTVTSGTWSGSFGAVSGANLTSLTAGNLTGTIPSAVLGNSVHFIGTTSIALNRASASQSLTGVNIDGSSGSCTGAAASNVLKAGDTMTGNLNWGATNLGLTWVMNTDGASIKFYNAGDGDTDSRLEFNTSDNGNEYFRWTHNAFESMRLVPNSSGNAVLTVSGSIVKSGGTSSQFLKADGSVDSNSYALSSHTHGNITNAGAIGSTANLPIITTTSGVLTTGSFGTTANTFCQGNDSRLSDTRNTTNSITFNNGGAGGASGSTFNGSGALTVSYNTIGAPSTTGANASGSWAISVTGSSGSCTGNAATASSTPYPAFSGDSVDKDNMTTRTDSGFYQSSTGTLAEGWPTDSGGWHHLISCTHTNDSNYYAMQISARFDTQNWYFRNTNGSGTTSWSTMLHSGNYNSYAPTLTGTGASGSWAINVTGSSASCTGTSTNATNVTAGGTVTTGTISSGKITPTYNSGVTGATAPNYTQANIELYTTGNNVPAIGFHRSGVSATALYEYDGQLYVNAWVARAQTGLLLSSGNYNSYAPTLTGTGASGSWGINITGSSASCTGNAATVTNGFYTTSSFNLGTTSIAVNRTSAVQSLTGINIDGSSGSCTGNAATATTATNVTSGMADNTDNYMNFRVMRNNNSVSNRDGMYIGFGNANSGDTRLYGGGNTATPVTISNGGALSASGNVIAYSSDKRLKENLNHIESPIEKIQKLNGYTFDWNEKSKEFGFVPKHEKNDIGLIAQEVEEVLPQATAQAPFDLDENGQSKSGENYLTVQYERLVPLLVEAIKEQQKMINSMKEEIQILKSK